MRLRADARKLDAATQAHLRSLVANAVRGGMSQTQAAATHGVSLRAVSKWMRLVRSGGIRALKADKRGRVTGSGRLNASQTARIRKLIVGKMPDQMQLPFYLWTREAVVRLMEREYGITMSQTTVGRYLKGWDECAEASAPRLRAQRRGDLALACRRISVHCRTSQTRAGRH